ncbi:MAG: fumarylacetoacetate hydrolase family protein [Caulobacterales bacterium]|nr:fumarylacetoacetate hydrolase family protein [Caulobacterales bacterium]
MRIAMYEYNDDIGIGAVIDDNIHVFDCEISLLGVAGLLPEFIENPIYNGVIIALEDVILLPPIIMPPRVFGIGLNYYDHALETGREPPQIQTWFPKQPTSINEPFGDVEKPIVSNMLDFEVELVVAIGKTCRHVPADRVGEVILGYMVGCDFSVRDWQKATPTMLMGKGFDTHAPIGPYLVTPEEIENIDDLRLRCFVNGEKMQDGAISELIFKIPQLIEHASKVMTLLPGDLIFTGTPAGVGVARNPPIFLKEGDVVRCEIDKIGFIENRIVNEVHETIIE